MFLLFPFLLLCLVHCEMQKGVNFLNGQWSAPKFTSNDAMKSFDLLKRSGTDYLALTFCWYQWNITSTTIYPRLGTSPTDAEITFITQYARARQAKVMVRPLVDPDWSNPQTQGTWRGMIGTNFTSSQWEAWFASYTAFIVHFARLAAQIGADEFSVGGELITPSFQEKHWRMLIRKVREVYSGPILYGANHGNEDNVAWWDAVDYIGVDAYYDLLPSNPAPSYNELVTAWDPIVTSLEKLSKKFNKSVIFSEIGYCSIGGANMDPAHCSSDATLNMTAQAVLYDVFYQRFWNQDWFAGVFWWAWLSDPANGGVSDKGFSPNGKPAEQIMRKWNSN